MIQFRLPLFLDVHFERDSLVFASSVWGVEGALGNDETITVIVKDLQKRTVTIYALKGFAEAFRKLPKSIIFLSSDPFRKATHVTLVI
jgi:hypothetical protein